MEKVITADGSITFRNKEIDETYHSHSGAATEARLKYGEPSGIVELARKARHNTTIHILDFCFGLGYNTAAAIDMIREVNTCCQIDIIGLEIDQTILDTACTIDAPFASYALVQKACRDHDAKEGDVRIRILLGDAKQTIATLDTHFDAVLFDPFSPKKVPVMWTADVFRSIFHVMRPAARLTTYSCARIARDSLRTAGFIVSDGPVVGRRGPSTIALKPNI